MPDDEKQPGVPSTAPAARAAPTGATNESERRRGRAGPARAAPPGAPDGHRPRPRGHVRHLGSGDTSGFGGLRLPAYAPAPAERPYGGWFDEVVDETAAALKRGASPRSTTPSRR